MEVKYGVESTVSRVGGMRTLQPVICTKYENLHARRSYAYLQSAISTRFAPFLSTCTSNQFIRFAQSILKLIYCFNLGDAFPIMTMNNTILKTFWK